MEGEYSPEITPAMIAAGSEVLQRLSGGQTSWEFVASEVYTAMMAKKSNPVKDPGFQRTLKNLLSAPPKPHSEMKVGKKKSKKKGPPSSK